MKKVWLTCINYGSSEQKHIISEVAPNQEQLMKVVKKGCREVFGDKPDLNLENSDKEDNNSTYTIYDRENQEYIEVSVSLMDIVEF